MIGYTMDWFLSYCLNVDALILQQFVRGVPPHVSALKCPNIAAQKYDRSCAETSLIGRQSSTQISWQMHRLYHCKTAGQPI